MKAVFAIVFLALVGVSMAGLLANYGAYSGYGGYYAPRSLGYSSSYAYPSYAAPIAYGGYAPTYGSYAYAPSAAYYSGYYK